MRNEDIVIGCHFSVNRFKSTEYQKGNCVRSTENTSKFDLNL